MSHKIVKLTFLLLIMLIFGACQLVRGPEPPTAPPTTTPSPTATRLPATTETITVTVKMDEITSKALAGNLLGDPATRKFYLLLPPSYAASNRRYPVLYVLPWGTSTPESNVWGFKTAYEQLLAAGEIPEMILVFPDGSNSLGASLFRSSATIGDYESYLVRELTGYVDANYPTIASRDSRALAGCSNGGDPSMRIALKYPDVFSVAAPSGGVYDETMAKNPFLLKELETLDTLPESASDVRGSAPPQVQWFIQTAGGSASNPDNPPLYVDMPFRLINGKAEILPEVADRIAANDTMHEVRRYLQQPLRLRGILIQHALFDSYNPTELVRDFDRLLTEQGIEHEYREFKSGHCSHPWEVLTLAFMAQHLVFDQPAK